MRLENPGKVVGTVLKKIFISFIRCYKILFAWKQPSCRYIPTCSSYAIEAVEKYGILKGGVLSLRRILRCRPGLEKYSNCGYDPVP